MAVAPVERATRLLWRLASRFEYVATIQKDIRGNGLTKRTYHCESQQRILKVLLSLFGHEITGMSPSQVAKLNDMSPAQTTRDLWNLEAAGVVERVPGADTVRISPRFGAKALQTMTAFDQAQRQLTDLQARYTRPQ